MNSHQFETQVTNIIYITPIIFVITDFCFFSYLAFISNINILQKMVYLLIAFVITGLFTFAIGILAGIILGCIIMVPVYIILNTCNYIMNLFFKEEINDDHSLHTIVEIPEIKDTISFDSTTSTIT